MYLWHEHFVQVGYDIVVWLSLCLGIKDEGPYFFFALVVCESAMSYSFVFFQILSHACEFCNF